jgi:hypothetical protein
MTANPDPFAFDLKDYCIIQPYEKAWAAPYDGKFHEGRLKRQNKIYPAFKKPRRIYMGAILQPTDRIRYAKEIAALVDKRRLAELHGQVADALSQMLYRAHCGDQQAVKAYVLATNHAVDSLQTLAKHQPLKVRRQSQTYSHWPVLLSLNPQDIEDAQQRLKSLGVGTNSILPTKSGQRVDYRHPWTQLALLALTACAKNKHAIPELVALCAGAKSERKVLKLWERTEHGATLYQLGNGDVVIIADWQEKCTKLRSR